MTFRVVCVVLGLSCLHLVGCGTTANLVRPFPEENGKLPFGGVKQDLHCLGLGSHGSCGCPQNAVPVCVEQPHSGSKLLCAMDLPLSFLGDIVTWPYAVTYRFINEPIAIPPLTHLPVLPVLVGVPVQPNSVLPPAKTTQPGVEPPAKKEPTEEEKETPKKTPPPEKP